MNKLQAIKAGLTVTKLEIKLLLKKKAGLIERYNQIDLGPDDETKVEKVNALLEDYAAYGRRLAELNYKLDDLEKCLEYEVGQCL